MTKPKIKDLLAARTALPPREVIVPVDVLTSPAETSQLVEKLASQEDVMAVGQMEERAGVERDRKIASQLDHERAPQIPTVLTGREDRKITRQEEARPRDQRKKFGTKLREQSIKQLRLIAMQEDREVQDIVQELVDTFIASRVE